MTNIGLVLSLFSGLAVFSVVMIVVAAFWSHSRSNARDRMEPAYEASNADPNNWLGDETR
jgi:hypothetical protein